MSCPLQRACSLSEPIPQYTETETRGPVFELFSDKIFCFHPVLMWDTLDGLLLKFPTGSNTFGFPFNLFGIFAFLLPGTPPPPVLFSAVKGAGMRVLGPWRNQAVSYASLTPFKSLQLVSVERMYSSCLMVLSLTLLARVLPSCMIWLCSVLQAQILNICRSFFRI